ncbi:MAG: chemotaxis protein CheW [Myxococcales bacterium]
MGKPDQSEGRRNELYARLQKLQADLAGVHAQLARLGPGEVLPGLFVLVDVGDQVAALPSSLVLEVVRLVKTTPLPEAPDHVLGTFVYRGEPALAIDLKRYLSLTTEEPDLDAHMVVLATARPMAIVVDRVRALVEAPQVAEAPKDAKNWLSSPLVAALCHAEGSLVAVLRIEPLLEGVPS